MHCSIVILTAVCVSDLFGTSFTLGLDDQYDQVCLTDYISTLTCSLTISDVSGSESPYRLEMSSSEERYNCTFTMKEQSLVCVLDVSPVIFNDADSYNISLYSGYRGNGHPVVLYEDYQPAEHIRPLAPGNLSMIWNKDEVVVEWQSGYDPDREIAKHLQHQLCIDGKHSGNYLVEVTSQRVSVEKSRFKPHMNFTVRVRTKPIQEYYKGVWSQWSSPLYWSSENIHPPPEGPLHMGMCLLLVPVSLGLLLCISYFRCRKQEYIPSPAPYFRDWNTDDKIGTSMSEKVRTIIQGDEALQIDIVTENRDIPPKQTTIQDEVTGMTLELEATTPQSPSTLHSPVGSEVDSGCWIRDVMATERGSITCSEDYCTLSHSYDTQK